MIKIEFNGDQFTVYRGEVEIDEGYILRQAESCNFFAKNCGIAAFLDKAFSVKSIKEYREIACRLVKPKVCNDSWPYVIYQDREDVVKVLKGLVEIGNSRAEDLFE